MSFDAYARNSRFAGDFTDLVEAANKGLLPGAKKRGRSRGKSGVKQRLSQAALLAPLLATEGCLTLGDEGGALADQEGAPPPAPDAQDAPTAPTAPTAPPATVQAVNDAGYHSDLNSDILISPDDLFANDQKPQDATLEIVRVFGASHGEVHLIDGLVRFTPDSGYEGVANFFYEVRDSNGNLSQAGVELHVGAMDQDGMDHAAHGMHMAVMELVPISEATHVAVNNGSWFDPNTWADGEIPGEGAKVLIPEGIEVLYDGESPVSLFTVRVDGALDFATDEDTFMEVDTLVVSQVGRLTIGTQDNPVSPNVQTIIQIADNGPIDVEWDPTLVSRGVITNGDVEIHGAYKDTFLKVAADPMAGDTSLTLESVPEGWRVGDKLVLTGTHLTETIGQDPNEAMINETEDEELIITSISGNVVNFDRPLEFDHEGARSDLKAYVANYTRNVRVQTENADDLPVYQRGHVMLMMSDDIDVRYAEFLDLGRTDKSHRAFDVEDLDTVESDSNVKARYSLHLHHLGVDDPENPAMLVGNSVWGSPGWGYVHHDSNAILADNAAYDTWGAGFVAETGNEIGRWVHNISIRTVGTAAAPKWFEDVVAFDLGRSGVNFWFQGRLVDALDNVAAGSPGGQGFVYMTRGAGQTIPIDSVNADFPETMHYWDKVDIALPSISQFEGNEAIAVNLGLQVVKSNSKQYHDDRSIIKDFTGWEVETGVELQYTAHYTLENIDVVGSTGAGGGVLGFRGIEYANSVFSTVVNGATVDGFQEGIYYNKNTTGLDPTFDNNWDYVFVDLDLKNNGEDMPTFDPAHDRLLSSSDLRTGDLLIDPDYDGIWGVPDPGADSFVLSGTKTDSLGEGPISPTWDPEYINLLAVRGAVAAEGYWTLSDGRIVTQIEQYFVDRVTGEADKISHFVTWEKGPNVFDVAPEYHGVLDRNSNAPVAVDDSATAPGVEESVIIDVLANDFDPDGDTTRVDGIVQPTHGQVFLNDDNTVTYAPDPNFSGTDEFWYWVEDNNGQFDKGHVTIEV
ncbi:Ig-like domain-containing protein [Hyphococcus luteus]|uniref:G8 domain-containing protein n=1 Tax=Hyphococcus luteus TaxID=2058213 RepID=A0A2S7K465_9PROT|nr:cadherin-like domain-containing protein [Marinicaulis flavus]PQA87304.1 hypothetical protein CW354_12795 [Marinicaulis flavus]